MNRSHRDREQQHHRDRHRDVRADPEVLHRERDADELGDDDQEVEQQDRPDRDVAPVAAETLADETSVADAGDGAESRHHLLVDDQDRDQQRQRPEQRVAEVLAGLGVGGDAAGVVVADHDDETGPDDGDEGEEAGPQSLAVADVMGLDGAEGSTDLLVVLLALHALPPFVSSWSLGETTTSKPGGGLGACQGSRARLRQFVVRRRAGTRGFQRVPL
jgi:hypothetical protein